MSSPATCPACARSNASHLAACLYCGERLPNPTPRPAPAAPPTNLDELVRNALRGGSVDLVRHALLAAREEDSGASAPRPAPPKPAPARSPPEAPPPRAGPGRRSPEAGPPPAEPPARVAAPPRAPVSPGPVSPEELAGPVEALRRVWATPDLGAAAAALDALDGLLASLRAELSVRAAAEGPGPAATDAGDPPSAGLRLPPVRLAAALVIEGLGDLGRASQLAACLRVDLATARPLAALHHPVVALRNDDVSVLEARVAALAAAGLRARVVMRAELLTLPLARPVLALGASGGPWRVGDGAPWASDEDLLSDAPPPARALPAPTKVLLAVPGEVATRRDRASATSRWQRERYATGGGAAERRRAVLDLHVSDGVLRVVEGMTDLRAWADGARLGWQRLVDALPTLFPGVVVVGRRSCSASYAAPDEPLLHSGWPTWEEHTRHCRLLRGV